VSAQDGAGETSEITRAAASLPAAYGDIDMYVLIVIFFQGGSSSPNAGFSQEFSSRGACHFAMNETKKAIQRVGGERPLVIHCVSKDKPQF
jgi:hypothetical protein